MAKYKQGYNAKGRAGSLKKQQELRAAKQKTWVKNPEAEEPEDSNAELMVPKSEAEKEERKRKLKEELTPTETKISSKKRKRLDKYIDKQLKREEKKALFSEFAARKGTFDTSQLKSIKHMGDKETKKSRIEEALRLEKLGLGTEETKEILYEKHEQKEWDDEKHSHLLTELERKEKEMAEEEEQENKSSFIDMRPKGGSGFGFQNLAKVSKPSKNSYSWRKKLEIEKARKNKKDYISSGEDDTDSDDSDEDSDEDEDEDEDEDDESDEGVTKKAKVAVEEDIEVDEEEDEDDEDEEVEDEDDEEDEEEDDEEEDDEESEEEETEIVTKKSKGSAFKEWIDEQTGPKSSNIDDLSHIKIKKERVERSEDRLTPPPEDIAQPEYAERKAFYVNVERDPEIQTSRMQLPVTGEEQRIMEAIFNNDCVIICGETGSGKTTQTPQFLIEAGFGTKGSGYPGMIGVTQPRRVAAISMAKRVANELGSEGHRVAHQVRFDVTVKDDTALKFMTDGVLLRELSQDFALTKYSALVIDEAHERNINTDILIGVLSRVLKLRKEMFNEGKCDSPLKLIIMSATLRVSDFTENKTLFPVPPPVLKVEARQYPVSVHFNKRTTYDYMDEIYRKTCKIHKRLPEGGILIFLTGQNEIVNVVKRLRKAFPDRSKVWKPKDKSEDLQVKVSASETVVEAEEVDFGADMRHQDYAAVEGESETDEEDGEEGFEEELAVEERNESAPLHVLPLYSLLPTKEQMKVFEEVPEGHRLCVVATNVAETSLTIPGIRYVVDCGRAKERKYDEETGVQSFEVDFISKASADQRAGRAGRTGPGHCYRVFSSAVYEEFFPQFSIPEILRCPVEGIVLEMKHMGIDKVVNFPFPTPPDRQSLAKAEKLLEYLGALSPAGVISDMGKQMSLFPLSPRFAKMLIIGSQLDCLPYMVAIVAALTVGDPFIGEHELGINEQPAKVKAATHDEDGDRIKANESDSEPEDIYEIERKRKLRSTYHKSQAKLASLDPASDALKLLSAVCAMDYDSDLENFCKGFFLRHKLMEEMRKLRQQLSRIVVANSDARAAPALKDQLAAKLKPPSKLQIKALKQMIATGFVDQVAQRLDKVTEEYKLTSRERIINVPYQTLFPTSTSNKKTDDQGNPLPDDSQVFIHPGSVINAMGTHPPEMLVFASVNRSGSSKLRMKPLCDITPAQIGNIAKGTALLTYSKPLPPPYGPKMLTSASRECWVVPRLGAAIGSGGTGWDLPPIKVKQEKKGSQWVTL